MSSTPGAASSALVWPVASPWALRRRGRSTAYLSSRQRALLWYCQLTLRRGPRTLDELARGIGATSRGQVSVELRRLRQLELLGVHARRGRNGSHRLWVPPTARRLRATLAGSRPAGRNDSTSTPFGGFIRVSDVAAAWQDGSAPPGPGGNGARAGPRRGHAPPRRLYGRCPAGHWTRLGRRSWRATPGELHATWRGLCARCSNRPVQETLDLVLVAPARDRSTAELRDPELLASRQRRARELLANDELPAVIREQLRRDYLD